MLYYLDVRARLHLRMLRMSKRSSNLRHNKFRDDMQQLPPGKRAPIPGPRKIGQEERSESGQNFGFFDQHLGAIRTRFTKIFETANAGIRTSLDRLGAYPDKFSSMWMKIFNVSHRFYNLFSYKAPRLRSNTASTIVGG